MIVSRSERSVVNPSRSRADYIRIIPFGTPAQPLWSSTGARSVVGRGRGRERHAFKSGAERSGGKTKKRIRVLWEQTRAQLSRIKNSFKTINAVACRHSVTEYSGRTRKANLGG